MLTVFDTMMLSGVIGVDVTRGGNWRCHPYFFLKKTDDLFCSSLYHYHFFRISPGGCHPGPFLPVQPRLSTILYKFSHNFFLIRVSASSPSDATDDAIITETNDTVLKQS